MKHKIKLWKTIPIDQTIKIDISFCVIWSHTPIFIGGLLFLFYRFPSIPKLFLTLQNPLKFTSISIPSIHFFFLIGYPKTNSSFFQYFFLDPFGSCWILLDPAGSFWIPLDPVGSCGSYWILGSIRIRLFPLASSPSTDLLSLSLFSHM